MNEVDVDVGAGVGRSLADAVATFVHREAALLDRRRLEEWLALFAPDGVLWVPGRPGQTDADRHVSIIYDRRPQLQARVTRLLSGKETAQDPPSATLRAVTNVVLTTDGVGAGADGRGAGDDGLVEVETVQVIYETRSVGAPLLVLPCRVAYRLRRLDAAPSSDSPFTFAIVAKRIDLLEVTRHFDNLAFLL